MLPANSLTESQLREQLAAKRKEFGNDHAEVAAAARQLGFRLANSLANKDRLAEAELLYREALAIDRKRWPNQLVKIEAAVRSLANLLERQGKTDEMERLFGEVLTPENQARPEAAGLLHSRASLFARQSRWKEAAAGFRQAIAAQPRDPSSWIALGPALIEAGDLPACRAHCQAMLAQFGSATNLSYSGEPIAKAGLLLPLDPSQAATGTNLARLAQRALEQSTNPVHGPMGGMGGGSVGTIQRGLGTDLGSFPPGPGQISRERMQVLMERNYQAARDAESQGLIGTNAAGGAALAERISPERMRLARTNGVIMGGFPSSQSAESLFTAGLADYRLGDLASATNKLALAKAQLEKRGSPRPNPRPGLFLEAQTCFVQSMAFHQQGHPEEARAALAKGSQIVQTQLAQPPAKDLGPSWQEAVIAQILMREAKGLTGQP